MSDYYSGVNKKLYDTIPPTAKSVLELGCANGNLGALFKQHHPSVVWHGMELFADAAANATRVLDRVWNIDINVCEHLDVLCEQTYDVIVIGDLLEHLTDPEKTLERLRAVSTPTTRICCCIPNMANITVLERLLTGDISYDSEGLLDRTHTKFFSVSSAIKMFLDAGWYPSVVDDYSFVLPNTPTTEHLISAAQSLGQPRSTIERNMGLWQFILTAKMIEPAATSLSSQPFSVIVPINRKWQYDLNVARSPGLQEIGAQLIPIINASTPAAAYEVGLKHAKHEWILLAHQDVYFPRGSGFRLANAFATIDPARKTDTVLGFAGLEGDQFVGNVVDRLRHFDHGVTANASSLDEFAIGLHVSSRLKIDPSIGWHAWATDLCYQAGESNAVCCNSVPLYHNSVGEFQVDDTFRASMQYLFSKYQTRQSIRTLCGNFVLQT